MTIFRLINKAKVRILLLALLAVIPIFTEEMLPEEKLYLAIEAHNLKLVKELVSSGVDPNSRAYGSDALSIAARNDDQAIIKYLFPLVKDRQSALCENSLPNTRRTLLSLGSSPHITCPTTTSHLASTPPIESCLPDMQAEGYTQNVFNCYKVFLEYGANPNAIGLGRGPIVESPLTLLQKASWYGASSSVIGLLLESGADPNFGEMETGSALMHAARRGDQKSLKLLLQYGASTETKDNKNETAFDLAKNSSITNILRSPSNKKIPSSRTCKSCPKPTDLVTAIRQLDTNAAKTFVSQGINVNIPNTLNQFALHEATASGQNGLVELLLEKGAEVNLLDRYGLKAVDYAVAVGDDSLFEKLIEKTDDASSTLCFAVNNSLLKRILSKKLNPNIKCHDKRPPIFRCLPSTIDHNNYARSANCVELYLNHPKLDIEVGDPEWSNMPILHRFSRSIGSETEIIDKILSAGADIDAKDDDGMTALMLALRFGNSNIAKHLLCHYKPDINIKNKEGKKAFQLLGSGNAKEVADQFTAGELCQ